MGRVIMSTYSEFLGLYPPANPASPSAEAAATDKAMPPMKIRRSQAKIEEE
jgi:hypothetical protein